MNGGQFMPVERRNDGSIYIKSKDGGVVIGRMRFTSSEKLNANYLEWVDECAKLVTPCEHTLQETEKHFLEQCDIMPLDLNDMKMKSFKQNLIMNHCKDKLEHKAVAFSFDMADEEIEKWHEEESAMRQEAMNVSPDKLGLNMRGYHLPHTERNKSFYREAYEDMQKHMKCSKDDLEEISMQDIYFFFEENTGNFNASGGGHKLMQQLIVFRGVNEEDIRDHTPRFLGYISALRELGVLRDFRENIEYNKQE
jgi:hypothetical protein